MNIDEKLRKYLGTDIEPLNEQMSDDELVNSMVEFLLELDEEALSDEMSVRLHDILNELDSDGEAAEDEDPDEENEGEVSEKRLLKKTSAKGRRKSKMYYRKNKAKIKARLRKLKPKIARMEKMGKGLSGKKLGLTKQR